MNEIPQEKLCTVVYMGQSPVRVVFSLAYLYSAVQFTWVVVRMFADRSLFHFRNLCLSVSAGSAGMHTDCWLVCVPVLLVWLCTVYSLSLWAGKVPSTFSLKGASKLPVIKVISAFTGNFSWSRHQHCCAVRLVLVCACHVKPTLMIRTTLEAVHGWRFGRDRSGIVRFFVL